MGGEAASFRPLRHAVMAVSTGTSVNSEDRPRSPDEVAVLKTGAVSKGVFFPKEHKAIVPSERSRASCPVRGGTVIVSRMNTRELVGESGYVERDHPDLFLPDRLWALKPSPETWPRWLGHLLASEGMRAEIGRRATGTSGSMKNLSQAALLAIRVHMPPLPEQRRIAAVLDAWDEAIALNARLVEEKRRWRNGTRDVLMASNMATPLSVLSDIRFSGVDKKVASNEMPVRLCNYMDVLNNDRIADDLPFSAGSATPRERERFGLQDGDVIFTKDSETPEDIAECAVVEGPGGDLVCGYHLAIARPRRGRANGRYLAHAIRTAAVRSQFVNRVNGVTRFGLTLEAVAEVEIPTTSLERQVRIAAYLDALTDEIDLLVARTRLLRRQKRGLMQRLLTGEVRVPESIEALMPGPVREAAE